jgi:hypothetical protein
MNSKRDGNICAADNVHKLKILLEAVDSQRVFLHDTMSVLFINTNRICDNSR